MYSEARPSLLSAPTPLCLCGNETQPNYILTLHDHGTCMSEDVQHEQSASHSAHEIYIRV
jgi:hypothetical protein